MTFSQISGARGKSAEVAKHEAEKGRGGGETGELHGDRAGAGLADDVEPVALQRQSPLSQHHLQDHQQLLRDINVRVPVLSSIHQSYIIVHTLLFLLILLSVNLECQLFYKSLSSTTQNFVQNTRGLFE